MNSAETTGAEAWEVPVSANFRARKNRALLKARFKMEIGASRLRSKNLGVVGAYNTSNIGDLAMGWTVMRLSKQFGARPELQSVSGLPAYPVRERTVLGGGGLMTMHPSNSTLHRLLRYPPASMAFVGVDGVVNPDECSDQVRSMLQSVSWIGVRNQNTRRKLEALTGRSDVQVTPDIAFGLALAAGRQIQARSAQSCEPVLGINMVPNLISVQAGQIRMLSEPSEWFRRHLPEEAVVFGEIGPRYVEIVRRIVEIYRQRGWTVRHIPFAVEDDTLARTVLANDGVEFVPYRGNPLQVLTSVSECTRMLASRFHAHVFALLAETPVVSLAYAGKCRALWSEFGLDSETQVTNLQMVSHPNRAVDALVSVDPAVFEKSLHEEVQRQACSAVHQALSALGAT